MSEAMLTHSDREAIGQLRALLRGEHDLTAVEEEALIASFLEYRPAPGGQISIQRWHRPSYGALLLHPGVFQTGVIALNVATVTALWQAATFNCLSCGGSFDFGFDGIALTPPAAILALSSIYALLPLVVLGGLSLIERGVAIAPRVRRAIVISIVGNGLIGLVEAGLIGVGGGGGNDGTNHLMLANVITLLISLAVAVYSAISARIGPRTALQVIYQERQHGAGSMGPRISGVQD